MKADDGIMSERANWTFAGEVATHFDTHVKKSIPGYDEGHKIVASLSDFSLYPRQPLFELGTFYRCSSPASCEPERPQVQCQIYWHRCRKRHGHTGTKALREPISCGDYRR